MRGTLSSLQEHFQNNQPRGEFTLIIEGNTKDEEDFEQLTGEISLQDAVEQLIKQGVDKKTAMKEVAVKYKVSKRDVYQALLGK